MNQIKVSSFSCGSGTSFFGTPLATQRVLPLEIQHQILLKYMTHSDINACFRTHRVFEQIFTPQLWRSFLYKYFPFCGEESQLSTKELFKHLFIMDRNIKSGMSFSVTKALVSYFNGYDLKGSTRLANALKIHKETLFHVGFGDAPYLKATTIDICSYKEEFDLDKPLSSFRIPRIDIISTCVNGDLFYLGAMNGDLLIIDYKNKLNIVTIKTANDPIKCIYAHKDRICTLSSLSNYLTIYNLIEGKLESKSIDIQGGVLNLQSYDNQLYCIMNSGYVVIDVEKAVIVDRVDLPIKMEGLPLIKNGFLYSYRDLGIQVWDIKKNALLYSCPLSGIVTGIGVHRDYVFVGVQGGEINVFDRTTGNYLSKVYSGLNDESAIAGFNFFKDNLYAYTNCGEIVRIDFSLTFYSNFSKGLSTALRFTSYVDFIFDCRIFQGPNRVLF